MIQFFNVYLVLKKLNICFHQYLPDMELINQ